jgi:hypothetical protein
MRLAAVAGEAVTSASAPDTEPGWGTGASVWPFPYVGASNVTGTTELAGLYGGGASRDLAMSIPAFRNGVNLIAGTCGSFPFTVTTPGNEPVPTPTFLTQPDRDEPPSVTWARIFNDLVLYPYAWLQITERTSTGFPLHGRHLPAGDVQITAEKRIVWDGLDVTANVIRFDNPNAPGALYDGARILSTSRLIEEATRRFATIDTPAGVLQQTGGPDLLDTEINDILNAWDTARQTRTTAFLSQTVDYRSVAFDPKALQLVEARNANAVDIARVLNLPPQFVNAETGNSLTYSTTQQQAQQLLNTTLIPYLTAFTGRLSMNDVTVRGDIVTPDLNQFLRADLNTRMQAYQVGIAAGIYTVDEVRASEGLPPAPEGTISNDPEPDTE